MNSFLEGFLLQASLIVALGAQNIFVLESGLKKNRHFLVASLCSICDLLLIAVGVLGAASLFVKFPLLKFTFGAVGILFLLYYGISKVLEGLKAEPASQKDFSDANSLRQTVLLTLGFSLLNPHVYLDTIVLVGGYSAKFSEFEQRLLFGAGAGALSVFWFFGLTFFAVSLSSLLNNPKSMRFISIVSGIILLILSWKLGSDVYQWFLLA